jgi:hypothetical protein
MAASLQGHQVHPGGRTWKSHFPNGDLWVFGYGYVNPARDGENGIQLIQGISLHPLKKTG